MKKVLILFIFSVILASIVIGIVFLVKSEGETCDLHKDFNEDGVCDICDTEIDSEPPVLQSPPTDNTTENEDSSSQSPACDSCIDTNLDAICDVCEQPIETQDKPCDVCIDFVADLFCDVCKREIKSEYEIGAFSISGLNILNHVIAYDSSESANEELANEIGSFFYEKAGIRLKIIDIGALKSENYIAVKSQNKSGKEGFYVKITPDKNLEFISEFPNKTLSAGKEYLELITSQSEKVAKLTEKVINVRDIFYKDFGAVGDGLTEDYNAIKSAHDYANEHGHTVNAEQNATYYISDIPKTIEISTDVSWNYATFIIDDGNLSSSSSDKSVSLFTVIPNAPPIIFGSEDSLITNLNERGLKSGSDRIDAELGFTAMLIIEDSGGQKESILIDESGNVDSKTPILSDFGEITSIRAIRTDEREITLSQGCFLTILNRKATVPLARNIKICRSNTVLTDLSYKIEENKNGSFSSDYLAFIDISDSCNVSVKNYSFEAHTISADAGGYAISITDSVNINLTGCEQTNYYGFDGITPSEKCKAVFVSSYSKNITVTACTASVFWAKDGVYQVTFIKSIFSHIIGVTKS